MFLWNLFKISGKHFHLADGVINLISRPKSCLHLPFKLQIYKIIESSLKAIDSSKASDPIRRFETDNRALLLLLKGAILRHINMPLQALKYFSHRYSIFFGSIFGFTCRCLEESVGLQKSIKEDSFIIPYAIVEIAFLHIDEGI